MAFRRSITARAKLLYQHPRLAAPFPHIHHDDNDQINPSRNDTVFKNPLISDHLQRRLFGTGSNLGSFHSSRNLFRHRRLAIPVGCGPVFVRNMSSLGEGPPENIEVMTDMATVLGDKAADVASQVGPVANEVAIAAAESFLPVAAVQNLIDYVHCYTGFNWWASIVVTTILIRSIQLPLSIHTAKYELKFELLNPRLNEIIKAMQNKDMTVAEGQKQMEELYKEYGVKQFTPLNGYVITGSTVCCFFAAVSNMAKNVPSFENGGAFWFTDLTTTDSTYIFPILMSLLILIQEEYFTSRNPPKELEGYITPGTLKNIVRVLAASTIPLTAMLTNATFCYWITNTLFGFALKIMLKKPRVQEVLGFPIIPSSKPANKKRYSPSKD